MSAKKPIQFQRILQFLVLVVVILSLVAGYYYTQFKYVERKYNNLQLQYTELE